MDERVYSVVLESIQGLVLTFTLTAADPDDGLEGLPFPTTRSFGLDLLEGAWDALVHRDGLEQSALLDALIDVELSDPTWHEDHLDEFVTSSSTRVDGDTATVTLVVADAQWVTGLTTDQPLHFTTTAVDVFSE